jgi:hypothetical protein
MENIIQGHHPIRQILDFRTRQNTSGVSTGQSQFIAEERVTSANMRIAGGQMKAFKVILLEEYGKPVLAEKLQEAIVSSAKLGWTLSQISTGGGGTADNIQCWVYLVFEL